MKNLNKTFKNISTQKDIYNRLQKAKLYIENHLHTNCDLDAVAVEACLSKYHFLRLFKEIYGITPYQYITFVRLNRAQQLLHKTKKPVRDICYEIGYQDVSSFGRLYKKTFGNTPVSARALQ